MSAIDFVIIALIAVAFGAVVVRVRKKGTCGDCAQAGSCGGSCAGCSTSSVRPARPAKGSSRQ